MSLDLMNKTRWQWPKCGQNIGTSLLAIGRALFKIGNVASALLALKAVLSLLMSF